MRQRRDRTGLYVLAAAVCDAADAARLRATVGELQRGRRRFHWHDEERADRHRAVTLVGKLDALHLVVVGTGLDNPRQERARRECLTRLLWELEQAGVSQVWLDSRRPAQNRRDIQLVDFLRVRRTLAGSLRADFVTSTDEPLVWLPDIVAGAVSAAYGDGDDQYLRTLGDVVAEPIMITLT